MIITPLLEEYLRQKRALYAHQRTTSCSFSWFKILSVVEQFWEMIDLMEASEARNFTECLNYEAAFVLSWVKLDLPLGFPCDNAGSVRIPINNTILPQ